jgi:hypothetical protein
MPVSAARESGAVVVRGGVFVGAADYRLEAALVRTAAGAARLDVRAVPLGAAGAGAAGGAAHYDYTAVIAAPAANPLDVTVVHAVRGTADTVFRGRVF